MGEGNIRKRTGLSARAENERSLPVECVGAPQVRHRAQWRQRGHDIDSVFADMAVHLDSRPGAANGRRESTTRANQPSGANQSAGADAAGTAVRDTLDVIRCIRLIQNLSYVDSPADKAFEQGRGQA